MELPGTRKAPQGPRRPHGWDGTPPGGPRGRFREGPLGPEEGRGVRGRARPPRSARSPAPEDPTGTGRRRTPLLAQRSEKKETGRLWKPRRSGRRESCVRKTNLALKVTRWLRKQIEKNKASAAPPSGAEPRNERPSGRNTHRPACELTAGVQRKRQPASHCGRDATIPDASAHRRADAPTRPGRRRPPGPNSSSAKRRPMNS